jgi:predicted lipid-binding transport protein (Tim44 family)
MQKERVPAVEPEVLHMKRLFTLLALLLAVGTFLSADIADARRIGGGRSLGAQRQMTPTPAPSPSAPSATPSAPVSPSQAIPGRIAPTAAPAASGMSRWLGPIAGLAAGLGLAALLSHFGLSEGFGSILLIALLVGGGLLLVRMFLRRRVPAAPQMQYAGVAAPRVEPHVGPAAFEPVMGSATPPQSTSDRRYPPGFEPGPFIEQAKLQFRSLQAAYDGSDRKALAEVMTPDMFAEISTELAQRESHLPTEVVKLDAEIVDVTTEGNKHWMSVRFTGLLREDGTVMAKDFDEVWNLVKPVDGSSGWLLAGIQQANEVA